MRSTSTVHPQPAMKTSRLAALAAALVATGVSTPCALLAQSTNPSIPVGNITAFPLIVQPGTRPNLTWNITYPSIVQDVVGSQRDALIVRSTIDLAHSLGLKVVAEGIETNDQFSLLSAMGCDQAQGYLVARPMPLRRLFEFLDQDRQDLRHHA